MPGLDHDRHQEMKNRNFGINLLSQAKIWENEFREALAAGNPAVDVYALYKERLRWLQHERLVHLLVLMMTVIALLSSVGAVFLLPGTAAVWILTLILLVLTAAYLIHYFKLENLVQRWYLIENEILRFSSRED